MTRLGILVSSDAVRALLVRSGRVRWHGRSPIESGERAGAALDRVLSTLPRARVGRTTARVAFGLAHSDTKRVDGVPPARQFEIVKQLVTENADAFFLRLGSRTFVAGVELRADGSTWASAFDATLLDDVFGVLRKRRVAAGFMSFAVAAAHGVAAGTWRARDAGLELEFATAAGGALVGLSRRSRAGMGDVRAADAPALQALGDDAPQFLAAFGAAVAPARAVVAWRPAPDPSRVHALEVVRVAAATLLFTASAAAALVARGVHADRVAKSAAHELALFRVSEAAATRVDAELRRTTAELDRVHQFEAARGRLTALLAALSEALPDSTALVSLRVDSAEANLVALTPHAANVLPPLLDVADVVAPRIVGSVTRETQGAARVERASVRFRRAGASRSDASAPAPRSPR